MKELSRISKILMFISVLSGSLWLGSYLTRLFITYQLFEEKDLSLKAYITQENLNGILTTLLPAVSTTFILYIIFILSFILFLSTSKLILKNNGWLFITAIIILVTLPFEAYLMTIDYKLISQLYIGTFESSVMVELLVDRIKILSSFPLVEIFCYFSIFYFILFKPLTAKQKVTQ